MSDLLHTALEMLTALLDDRRDLIALLDDHRDLTDNEGVYGVSAKFTVSEIQDFIGVLEAALPAEVAKLPLDSAPKADWQTRVELA